MENDAVKILNEIFVFLLSKEGYTGEQIRQVVGKIDNNRLAQIRAGLTSKKQQNNGKIKK